MPVSRGRSSPFYICRPWGRTALMMGWLRPLLAAADRATDVDHIRDGRRCLEGVLVAHGCLSGSLAIHAGDGVRIAARVRVDDHHLAGLADGVAEPGVVVGRWRVGAPAEQSDHEDDRKLVHLVLRLWLRG